MSRDQAPGRRREYTAAEARRWAAAVTDGLTRPEFKARFGLTVEAAREQAVRLGVELPAMDRRGDVQQAKAPALPERSVLWFPTPRARRKAGAVRRRMT